MELRNGYSDLRLRTAADPSRPVTYLHPGHMVVSAEPMTLMTILGSCVAVCLWDPVRRASGMAHYLLPKWEPGCGAPSPRYGNIAIDALIQKMSELGCRPATMQARIFGGGSVLKAFRQPGKEHLGIKNAELAHQKLSERGIRIVESDTSGNVTRKVTFDAETGIALITRVGDRDGI